MTPEQRQEIELRLLQSEAIYYLLFRTAIQQQDAVAEYMALYGIILSIVHNSQVNVDQFIISKGFVGGVFPRRNARLPPESIFAKIRNDVGHTNRGHIHKYKSNTPSND